ncbi:unnamed protein product [Protopolystoma xenopodis]|uniref:Uncharacterized protein n=1 Tax=Protopolystoma xenopodis TaxID=117903 RepID=A0A3S5CE77_9PLAT|nr:unnamed protein product [Protopolystoma xenopodis]
MMASLTDNADYDAGESFGYVPSQFSKAENHEYYGRGHRTRYVPQVLAGSFSLGHHLLTLAGALFLRYSLAPYFHALAAVSCLNKSLIVSPNSSNINSPSWLQCHSSNQSSLSDQPLFRVTVIVRLLTSLFSLSSPTCTSIFIYVKTPSTVTAIYLFTASALHYFVSYLSIGLDGSLTGSESLRMAGPSELERKIQQPDISKACTADDKDHVMGKRPQIQLLPLETVSEYTGMVAETMATDRSEGKEKVTVLEKASSDFGKIPDIGLTDLADIQVDHIDLCLGHA